MRLAIGVGVGVLLFGLFGGDHGLPAMLQARREAQMLSTEIAALRTENAALRQRAAALRSDPTAIESEARATLGLLRPGEVVVARPK